MSKKLVKFIPVLVLLFGIAIFAILILTRGQPEVAPPSLEIALVETRELDAQSGTIRIKGDGFVRPRAEVWVTPQVSGRVVAVSPGLVSGGRLQAGETLLQIDPTPFQAELDQAVANHEAAMANLEFLRKQYARSKTLFERKDISEAQLDETFSQLKQVEADVRRLEALIQRRRFDLEQAAITLPFDARVVEESVDVGDTVAIGQQLARVYELGMGEITVSLTEADAALIPELWSRRPGMETSPNATVTASFGGKAYQWDAYLDRVNAGLSETTRTVDVVVVVPSPERPGRPLDPAAAEEAPPLVMGTYADVELTGRSLPRYYAVPSRAVREGPTVWLATAQSTLEILPVNRVYEADGTAFITAETDIDGRKLIVSDLVSAIPDMPLVTAADGTAQ